MAFVDKTSVLGTIEERNFVAVELGCGSRKRVEGSIGIDILENDAVDIVGDVLEVLKQFPKASIDEIHSHHFIEHIPDLGELMDELARVMKKGGTMRFVAPHFSNPYYYSDASHRTHCGLYTMSYFAKSTIFRRKVPTYAHVLAFEVLSVDLVLKSTPPFYLRHILKSLAGKLVNLSSYTKELYEEVFCYLFPCYEVSYHLKKL